MPSFFELSTPRDMFEKAEREYQWLQQSLDADTVFNFFVTAYHIVDYVKVSGAVPGADLDAFLAQPELQFTRDLCDKGKHLKLDRRPYPDPGTGVWSGMFRGHPLRTKMLGDPREIYVLFVDDHSRAIDVYGLASAVLDKWRQFLATYGL